MQAVIMAAGKGTRLGEISKSVPKSLVKIAGKAIIDFAFAALPSAVDRVVVVIGHLGYLIREHVGEKFCGFDIQFVEQKNIPGTAGALWQAKPLLGGGKFLVVNGDDIYDKKEIAECLTHDLAFGLTKRALLKPGYISIDTGADSMISGWHKPAEDELKGGINIANGVYVLDKGIFDFSPVPISNGEYGLPHTILEMAKTRKVRGVMMKHWFQVNTLDDVKFTEAGLLSKID